MAVFDRTSLHRAGLRPPSTWWALLGPAYLFLRPRAGGASLAMGVSWCAAFVLSLTIPDRSGGHDRGAHLHRPNRNSSGGRPAHRIDVFSAWLASPAGAQVGEMGVASPADGVGSSFQWAGVLPLKSV